MGNLAKASGADKTTVLDGWVHPADRPPPAPGAVLLYGRWWSAEDAAYAKELELDESLRAPDLERLWRTNRPSVRAEGVQLDREQAPAKLNTPDSQAERVAPVVTTFAQWLAGSGLSVRKVAERLGVAPGTVHNWKAKGAPAEIMAKLEG